MRVKQSLLAGLVVGAMGTVAAAAPLTISASVKENGGTPSLNGTSAVFTSGAGYDFTATQYNTLTSITDITVTMTINNGNSDIGEFDENNLFLTLDGVNTGLALNGFSTGQIVTLTLTQLNPGTGAAILAALLSDGKLVGGVLDTDADGPNNMAFPAAITTFLDITGNSTSNGGGGGPGQVPLPAAVLLAPLGAGLAGAAARRFRKAK